MSSTPEKSVLERISRAWRKVRRRTAVGENPRRSKGSPRKNSFNNRDLITELADECILLENFEAVERGDTGQGGRVTVTSCGGFLDVVGVEGPMAVNTDSGTIELIAGVVEVAHADLVEVPRMVVVRENTVVVHASGVTAASGVLSILPDVGRRRHCRRRRCPLNSIPLFP